MATLRLGDDREDLELVLCRDDDFVETIRLEAGPRNPDGLREGTPIDWPTGTQAWIWVRGHSESTVQRWPAIVDGPYLRFDVPHEQVDVLPERTGARVILDYGDGKGEFIWAKGRVTWV